MHSRTALLATLFLFCSVPFALGADDPLPDPGTLFQQVVAHQKQVEKTRENYTYHEFQKVEELNSNGSVKKTETSEYDDFYVHGHSLQRMVQKNGRPLDGDELKKEEKRITEEAQKAESNKLHRSFEIKLSRIIQLMKFTNPRREILNGRSTLVLNFSGNEAEKASNLLENAFKKLAGTVWVDEQDKQIVRFDGHFTEDFRVGGGLLGSIHKGSRFLMEQSLIHNEVWLPSSGQAELSARTLLKNSRQRISTTFSDYQRFHTDAEQQPGSTVLR